MHLPASLRRMRLSTISLLAAAALAGTTPAMADKADDTLNAAVAREILTLDNFNSTARENEIISLLVDDALFYINPDSGKPEPLSAASYQFVDPLTLDVVIRDDVTFHDGTPLTTADVAYTFTALLSEGAEFSKSSNVARWLDSVEAVDDTTVRFHLAAADPLVLHSLSTSGRLVKDGTYGEIGSLDINAQSQSLIGLGPYEVVSFTPGQEVVLKRYEGYREDSPKGMPAIGNITFKTIPDYATQAAEVLTGGVQWTYSIPTDVAQQFSASGDIVMMSSPSMRIGYIVLDAMGKSDPDGPMTRLEVRQALNYAVDRQTLVDTMVGGSAAPAQTPCLPIQFGCVQDVTTYPYDPEKARELLAEAGYPDGFSVEIWASREQQPLEAVMQMWRDVGIDATLRSALSPAIQEAKGQNQLAAFFDNNGSVGVADIGAIIPGQLGRGAPNAMHGNEELYTQIEAMMATSDADVRLAAAREVIETTTANAYWVPLYEFPQNFLLSSELDYPQAADGMQRLFLARWKD